MPAPKTEARAFALMGLLLEGPCDKATILNEFEWSRDTFGGVLTYLRRHVCPEVGAVLPRPVADDGYCYHLIDAEHPDRPAFWTGSSTATGDADTRLRGILRDFSIYSAIVDGRTLEGRKARMIEQHLRHLVENIDLMDELSSQMAGVNA